MAIFKVHYSFTCQECSKPRSAWTKVDPSARSLHSRACTLWFSVRTVPHFSNPSSRLPLP